MTHVRNRILGTLVIVPETERALVLKDGQFDRILTPGRHKLAGWTHPYTVSAFSLVRPECIDKALLTLQKEHPEIAQGHLTEVRTDLNEVALIYRDGKAYAVQSPDNASLLWTDAGPWNVEKFDVSEDLEVPKTLALRLSKLGAVSKVKTFHVGEGQTGLLFTDGALIRELKAGTYAFWNVGRIVDVRLIDLREHAIDVTGQEILTRDKVSVRVNLAAKYRVTDPVLAVTRVKDFADSLYRALQHAFRKSLGTKSLDEILGDKVTVDAQAAKVVRADMKAIGLEVGEIAIKDVILPGDMRDILNRVVEAEKEAEANVIRRREETSATRQLLNTAKVMAENPVMLRLKELEALETVAGKVQSLTVHNGTRGLLDDIVSLKGDR